ncbi:hypothetical protein [Marinobacter salarius]|uniref:hypothetical protein n=1 Tax=Marinobacter salarius TaxID=1420917 RepID=UPI003007FCCF
MPIVVARDLALVLYFIVVFFLYLFWITPGEDPGVYVYYSLLIGSVIVFVFCSLHLFVSRDQKLNKIFISSFILLALCTFFDLFLHGQTNIVNFMFFLVFAWSVYSYPVRGFRVVVNFLFLVAVAWSIISYYIGINPWGFFPGQATTNLSQGLWWRVGIFPSQTPPFSGAFALIVFIINFKASGAVARVLTLISLYFMIFAGSRAIVVAFVLCAIVYFLSFKIRLRGIPIILVIMASISFVFLLSNIPALLAPLFSWSEFLSSLILRAGEGAQVDSTPDSRSLIFFHFSQHIVASWPSGMGANTLAAVYDGPGGSEMPGVRIVAESGVWGVGALVSLSFFGFMRSVDSKLFMVLFFILMFFYGSFLHPYTPVFLAMLCILSGRQWRVEHPKKGIFFNV